MKPFVLLVILSLGAHAAEFGAYYTKVDSGEEFEKFSRTSDEADIVVQGVAGDAGRLVFSRATESSPERVEMKATSPEDISIDGAKPIQL